MLYSTSQNARCREFELLESQAGERLHKHHTDRLLRPVRMAERPSESQETATNAWSYKDWTASSIIGTGNCVLERFCDKENITNYWIPKRTKQLPCVDLKR